MTKEFASERAGFRAFELDPALERGIEAAGFTEPRPIQEKTIPAALEGRDILGLAQTGTGKTAAFALPLLDRIIARRRRGPLALVLAPTRELATQIDAEIRTLSRFARVSTMTIYGGVSMNTQIRALRARPDLLVACPGRLLDLHERGFVNFSAIEALVLDEADHMFDMGFLPDIKKILALLPETRQNLLFSATMPQEIRGLANHILHDPHVVELGHSRPAATIDHALYPVAEGSKRAMLDHLLAEEDCRTAIVFTRTKHRAKRLAEQLSRSGHRAVALQGNMSQGQRDRAMKGFRTGRFDILVATDIVARGIDVTGVSYVINFDPPNSPEAYTHRIGRTGRSDTAGRACTMVGSADRGWIHATERYLGQEIPRCQVSGFETVELTVRSRPSRPAARTTNGGGQYRQQGRRRDRRRRAG